MRLGFLPLVGILLSLVVRPAVEAETGTQVWPENTSDIAPDARLRAGTLPNGLRYAVLPNDEPKGRVSLRLVVAVGSVQETDEERGMAHFVEHMIFRGTTRYPGDSLTAELQRIGVGFGAENTAFTYFDHTDYHLDLPDTQDATLRRGFEIFRQYAEAVTFEPKFIELERGVVLSEKATRDTAAYRNLSNNLAFLWPGSRCVLRPPIGDETAIRHFTREQLVSFYHAWYRPERMAVVVVGNVDPDVATRLLSDVFVSLDARGSARAEPLDKVPKDAAKPSVMISTDPGITGVTLVFEHPRRVPMISLRREDRVEELHRALAFAMFQRRLQRITRESGETLVAPAAYVATPVQGWQVATFSASGRGTSWQELAKKIEQEHRRAFRWGFTEEELETTRKEFSEGYALSVRMAGSRRSEMLAAQIVGSLLSGEPLMDPTTIRDEMAQPLATATVKDCTMAFRQSWDTHALHVFVTTHTSVRIDSSEVAKVLNESRKVEVEARAETKSPPFEYTDFGPPGALVKDRTVPDLGLRLTEFQNGVRLNFKATDFEKDLVRFQIRVGHGLLALPENKPGLGLLAQYTLINGGVRKHTPPELRDILAGRSVQFGFYADLDAFVFYGYSARRDLSLAMEMIAAYCSDARFDSEAMRDASASYNSMWSSLEASPGGPIHMSSERVMLGDHRFGVPWLTEFAQRSIAEVSLYLDPELKEGPIEMSIVGDATWEEAFGSVAQTLGALAKRKPRIERADRDFPRFTGDRKKPYVYISPARLTQTALAWYWPVEDREDIHRDRRCDLLASVITDRIRVRLRQELGTAYAPSAAYYPREGIPAVNYFMMYAEVEYARATQAAEIVNKEIELLRTKGVTDDEFLRAKQPFLRTRQDDLRSNEYWCYRVLREPQRRPDSIDAARDRVADSAAISKKDLEKLAERYLTRKNAYFMVAEPGRAHAWKK